MSVFQFVCQEGTPHDPHMWETPIVFFTHLAFVSAAVSPLLKLTVRSDTETSLSITTPTSVLHIRLVSMWTPGTHMSLHPPAQTPHKYQKYRTDEHCYPSLLDYYLFPITPVTLIHQGYCFNCQIPWSVLNCTDFNFSVSCLTIKMQP